MESFPYSGTSKRAKAPAGNITQTAHCLVDGCTADLNLCRDYHRRHKVCEAHSKTPVVKIGGREQRFCQQCSRFHSLGEFDEGKRSCRKRLDGHNRRRRKPQPDSLARAAPPGLVFSSQQSMSTARLLSFTAPQMLPTATAVVGNSWPGIVKPEHEMSMSLYNNHHPHQQLNYIERPSQFGDHSFHEHSFVDPTNVVSASSGSNRDRALSLLSSSAPTSTRDFVLNHVVAFQTGTESVYPPQPHQPALPHNYYGGSTTTTSLGQFATYFQESKPAASASDSHGSNTSTLHFPEMFQPAPEGSSTGGSHQTLTFTWE